MAVQLAAAAGWVAPAAMDGRGRGDRRQQPRERDRVTRGPKTRMTRAMGSAAPDRRRQAARSLITWAFRYSPVNNIIYMLLVFTGRHSRLELAVGNALFFAETTIPARADQSLLNVSYDPTRQLYEDSTGPFERVHEQPAEACLAGSDCAAEHRWGRNDGDPAPDRQRLEQDRVKWKQSFHFLRNPVLIPRMRP